MPDDFSHMHATLWAQDITADASGEFVKVTVQTAGGSKVTYFVSLQPTCDRTTELVEETEVLGNKKRGVSLR